MKKNVLVFPCGSEIGLEVHRSLRYSTHFNVIGASSVADHGRFAYARHVDGLPFSHEPGFIDALNALVERHEIDFVVPTHDDVVLRLARAKAGGHLACEVVTSPLSTCEVANSKLETYREFRNTVATPRVYDAESLRAGDFPIFLKPEVGSGGRGTRVAGSIDDVRFFRRKDPTLLLLEYLPGREYTVDCFTNKDRVLLFCRGRERVRIANGISVGSATVDDPRFRTMGEAINEHLWFRGAWFFQAKARADGELVLTEIAPRIAGTMGLARCRGVNLPLLSLFDAMGNDVAIVENECTMVIDRALQNVYAHDIRYNHVYLDLDDSLLLDGKVNPVVIAFVYQCVNKGIRIHLLTRHGKDDLAGTLRRHRLTGVFDDVVCVSEGDNKHAHILHKDAILIDDSHAERSQASRMHHIPVFDAHMIESLLEMF